VFFDNLKYGTRTGSSNSKDTRSLTAVLPRELRIMTRLDNKITDDLFTGIYVVINHSCSSLLSERQ